MSSRGASGETCLSDTSTAWSGTPRTPSPNAPLDTRHSLASPFNTKAILQWTEGLWLTNSRDGHDTNSNTALDGMETFKKRTNTGTVYYDFDTRLRKSWESFKPMYIKTTEKAPINRRFIFAVILMLTFTALDAWHAWPVTPPEPCGDGDTFVKLGWGDWRLCNRNRARTCSSSTRARGRARRFYAKTNKATPGRRARP